MARLCFTLVILALALVVSSGESLTCTSQKFTNNNVYTNCTDLPHLSAYLHWTYNTTTSTLSMAFVAPPAKPEGWVAWAINPNKPAMAGAQTLLAFKDTDNITIKTYDINSPKPSKWGHNLSYGVRDLSAEHSNGTIKIFAKWKLPKNTETVNHVWQVGPGMTKEGLPLSHEMKPDNVQAKGTLQLVVATEGGGGGSPALAPQPAAGFVPESAPAPGPAADKKSGSSRIGERISVGFYMALLVILGSLIVV